MHATASLIGIVFTVVAILVMIRAVDLGSILRLVKRGIMAILAFVVLGTVARVLFPGILTDGFYAGARSSLLLGVAIVVIALALMLIAKWRSTGGNSHR